MGSRIRYEFQALQKENYWLPPAFAAIFLIIVAILGPERDLSTGRAFLGYLLPLLTGGLSAYAILSDPALELQFATKRSAVRMIVERLGTIFGIVVVIGILYQLGLSALGVSLSSWGRSLAAPMGLACAVLHDIDPGRDGFFMGVQFARRLCIGRRVVDPSTGGARLVFRPSHLSQPFSFLCCNGSPR